MITKTNFVLTLSLLTVVQSAKHCKDIVKFDGKFYKKEYLADGTVCKPFLMTYLDTENIIFTEDSEPLGNTSTYILDINTKKLKEINADKAVVHAVDRNGTIYIGQDGGLFIYNLQKDTFEFLDLKDAVIKALQVKDDLLYYIDYPYMNLNVYENGVSNVLIRDSGIHDLVFDDKNNMFYYNRTGAYVKLFNNETVSLNADIDVPFADLSYDASQDSVFALSVFGVFKVDLLKRELRRISMKMMFDIVFDSDGRIIYSDEESIVRLWPTAVTC